jgi:hypothetical protein
MGHNMTNDNRRQRNGNWLQWGILGIFLVSALIWAWRIPYNGAPDEEMRYLLPTYLYRHGQLPLGTQAAVTYKLGNWSYAFYPQWLGPLVSAGLMKLMSLVATSPHALLFAARLTSVLAATVSLWLCGRLSTTLAHSAAVGGLVMAAVGFLPQYLYLASYVNNDILSVLGVAMIVTAIVQNRWRYRDCLLFAGGISVCALSYLNAYGYILAALVYFIGMGVIVVKQHRWSPRQFVGKAGLIALVCGVVVLPFYVRNIIVYGDMFGLRAFHAAYARWLADGGAVLQRPYPGTLQQLLTDPVFFTKLRLSSIGRFGYLSVTMSGQVYRLYSLLWSTLFLGAGVGILMAGYRHWRQGDLRERVAKALLSVLSIALGSLITVALYLYYCLATDYQAQGRYLVTLVVPLAALIAVGWGALFKRVQQPVQFWLVMPVTGALVIGIVEVYRWYVTQI